jgi:hypothetical protein
VRQTLRQLPRCADTYLGVIDFAGAEQGAQRVVCGDGEASDVNEEGPGNVEEDEEEVQPDEAEEGVDLGHRGLLLQVVEGGVLGQLGTRSLAGGTRRGDCAARRWTWQACCCKHQAAANDRTCGLIVVHRNVPPCRAATGGLVLSLEQT